MYNFSVMYVVGDSLRHVALGRSGTPSRPIIDDRDVSTKQNATNTKYRNLSCIIT